MTITGSATLSLQNTSLWSPCWWGFCSVHQKVFPSFVVISTGSPVWFCDSSISFENKNKTKYKHKMRNKWRFFKSKDHFIVLYLLEYVLGILVITIRPIPGNVPFDCHPEQLWLWSPFKNMESTDLLVYVALTLTGHSTTRTLIYKMKEVADHFHSFSSSLELHKTTIMKNHVSIVLINDYDYRTTFLYQSPVLRQTLIALSC